MPTATAKDSVREMLDQLPEDATIEDIHYHLYVREKVEHALEAIKAGKVCSHDEARRRLY
jgi:hypothetical protein